MVALKLPDIIINSLCLRILILICLLFGLVIKAEVVEAQSPRANEYMVKLGYLYNFAKFVQWPQKNTLNGNKPITICILGENPFGAALASLQGKTAQGHPLAVRYLKKEMSFQACDMLFIAQSERYRLSEILAKLEDLSVLTVSDITGFARAGGMVGLVEKNRRITFEINLPEVQKSALTMSAQLLKLATIVGQ